MSNKIKRIFDNFTDLFKYPKILTRISKNTNLYFFFPCWSIGGAERVHIDILNLFKVEDPLCFITTKSQNSGFKKESKAAADIVNLGRWGEKNFYKAQMLEKIADQINTNKSPIVFGSNSRFMYELIPFLGGHVKIIDLIHNFSDDGKGIESFSIPYISRLHKRIVVGKGVAQQFKELYKCNNIPSDYLKKLVVIQNKVPFNNVFPKKDYNDILQILFVARNCPEKRVNVFIRIAKLCQQLNLPVEFSMIGNFSSEQNNVPQNTKIVGEVRDKAVLNTYYKKSHLLLLCSKTESWGLVIFEGMGFGVVPISTRVGELFDYISHKRENGVLVKNLDDIEELAILFVTELKKFCADRSLLKKFSENAFNTIADLAKTSDFDEAYKKILFDK